MKKVSTSRFPQLCHHLLQVSRNAQQCFFLEGGLDENPPAVFVPVNGEGGLIEWWGITEEEQPRARGSWCHNSVLGNQKQEQVRARGSWCHDSEQFVNFFSLPHHHHPQHVVFILRWNIDRSLKVTSLEDWCICNVCNSRFQDNHAYEWALNVITSLPTKKQLERRKHEINDESTEGFWLAVHIRL